MILGALAVGAAAGGFPDLHVYRYGGDAVLHQERLYATDDPVTGYPFTFPWCPDHRAELVESRAIGDVALLRYALSERFEG
ncbi:hypothetical protein GCM10009788_32870 [Nocardioides humi]|uniref:Uncharacterized protein n=1 Tax=Nocardioides humi TaxID=449461 RepID=A0ABN2ATH6_9ACTN